jgi:hypothetical protein
MSGKGSYEARKRGQIEELLQKLFTRLARAALKNTQDRAKCTDT